MVSVVIPALNEEGVVGKTIESIPVDELNRLGFEVEILVVDNNSTDNTAREAKSAGATVKKRSCNVYASKDLKTGI